MNPSHTFPSLSGTYRKRCKPAHKPNLRQEPSSPSRSNAMTDKHCRKIETFKSRKENSQHITMYKNNSRVTSKFKGCSPLQLSCKLKDSSSEVGYYSYTHRCSQCGTFKKHPLQSSRNIVYTF